MVENNRKMLVFDIDGTLCDLNRGVDERLTKILSRLSQTHTVVFASGKPVGYVAGFVRQLNLHSAVLVGENGGTTMFSHTFPPIDYLQIDVPSAVLKLFDTIRNGYVDEFGTAIWFQPNDVNLTIFPVKNTSVADVHRYAKQYESGAIDIYYHSDCVDFVPKGFDKGTAIEALLEKLDYGKQDLYVFGDGDNDRSMLVKTDNSVVVNNKAMNAMIHVNGYSELANYLEETFEMYP